jgi:hypothetical protein
MSKSDLPTPDYWAHHGNRGWGWDDVQPFFIILWLAADVDEPVDQRRVPSTRPRGLAMARPLALGRPLVSCLWSSSSTTDRNMDQRVPIAPADHDQDHASGRSSVSRLAKTHPADPRSNFVARACLRDSAVDQLSAQGAPLPAP